MKILLIDDEPLIRLSVSDALTNAGYVVSTAEDGEQALRMLNAENYDLVVTDIRMPKVDGLEVFRELRKSHPETDVILITAHGTIDDAVEALKLGATDYMTKPFEVAHLLHEVARVAQRRDLQYELTAARAALKERGSGAASMIVGRSPQMTRMLQRITTFGESDAPVLITGESGTGKELVAKTLHESSPRAGRAFVAVNCAAFPDTLIEAELFGHERGAFTGAVKKRDGRFRAAHGGTLFLDEIAEIPLPAQAKLLRVLQEGSIEPLGTNQSVKVDVRVISATHRNLRERIKQGLFREDLFYRLKVLELAIPHLRERTGNLPILVEHFLSVYSRGKKPSTLSARAWAALSGYPFPGNVRELEHAIHHAVVLSGGGEIDLHHLPMELAGDCLEGDGPINGSPMQLAPLAEASRSFEREYLIRALRLSGGKKGKAADMLGISRKNLWEKLKAQGVQEQEWEAAETASV